MSNPMKEVEEQLLHYLRMMVDAYDTADRTSFAGVVYKHGRVWRLADEQPQALNNQECYSNASALACDQAFVYCEGWAVPNNLPLPIWHAWVLNSNGEVIDPTWGGGSAYIGIPVKRQWHIAATVRHREHCIGGVVYAKGFPEPSKWLHPIQSKGISLQEHYDCTQLSELYSSS